MTTLREIAQAIQEQEKGLLQGGGKSGSDRQRKLGRLPVRERLSGLLDPKRPFLELGLWAAYGMYPEWGEVPAAGVITGLGFIEGRPCMIAANDATVKAGAMFPQSVKKLIRAQKIAYRLKLPIVYLVDSAGVFLPLQDEIFPDEDDFGRIFRNNSILSAEGIPQIAAVMGNCIAGGAYLPVLCDKILMTQGSQLCLAGPALVKAAIGQSVDPEELGGASMHAQISGTVDFHEPDDPACLARIRSLVALMPRMDAANTTCEICSLALSMPNHSRSLKRTLARPLSRAIPRSMVIRLGSSPISDSGPKQLKKRSKSAGSSTAMRPKKPHALFSIANRTECLCCSSRMSKGSWWASRPSNPGLSNPVPNWTEP